MEKTLTLEDYKLLLTFKNGEKRVYDAKKLLEYDFYKNLRDLKYFKEVKVVDGITIEWKSGEDVNPDDLYENSTLIN